MNRTTGRIRLSRFVEISILERNPVVIKHYLVNKTDRYAIDFRQQPNGTYKLHAVGHPPDPYRLPVTENHLYSTGEICVSGGREPRTLDRAKAIAMFWCEGWSVYVRTGAFPNKGKKVVV